MRTLCSIEVLEVAAVVAVVVVRIVWLILLSSLMQAALVHSTPTQQMMMSTTTECSKVMVAMHWFRKGLRLHDNPALIAACQAKKLFPVFCIDPHFAKPDIVGVNRYQFLLESLQDLDASLRARGSRLFVLQGKPEEVLIRAVEEWGITLLVSVWCCNACLPDIECIYVVYMYI